MLVEEVALQTCHGSILKSSCLSSSPGNYFFEGVFLWEVCSGGCPGSVGEIVINRPGSQRQEGHVRVSLDDDSSEKNSFNLIYLAPNKSILTQIWLGAWKPIPLVEFWNALPLT